MKSGILAAIGLMGLGTVLFAGPTKLSAAQLYDFNRFFNEPHPFTTGPAGSPPRLPTYRPQFVPSVPLGPQPPVVRVQQSRPGAPPPAPRPPMRPVKPAFASDTPKSLDGLYGAFNLIGGYSLVDDTSITGGGPLQLRNDTDTVFAFGIAAGYSWANAGWPIRTELEYHYRVRMDFDTRDTGTAGTPGYENDLESHVVLFNVYYDWVLSPRWTVYGGGGFGWAQNTSRVDRVNNATGAETTRTDSKSRLAWNAGLGVLWRWSRTSNWNLDLRYRYIDLGEVESGPHVGGEIISGDSYVSHDFVIGVIYDF